jgi:glycosyltransferase involved in cell wall biosynthesis
MASGIPALAHTACGNAEVVQDCANGFLRDLSDPDALRVALSAILAQPATLPALGAAARQTVETHFSFSAMVDGYRRLYLNAIHQIDVKKKIPTV